MSQELDAKDPDVPATYSINWFRQLVVEMKRDTEYAVNAIVRPPIGHSTGFYYKCTVAGRTSDRYPRLPRVDAQTVVDGSVTWTAVRPEDETVPIVQSAVWDVPDGLTLAEQSEDAFLTHVTLSGGTDGEDYDVTCRMTPSAGPVIEQTIVVPVRAQ